MECRVVISAIKAMTLHCHRIVLRRTGSIHRDLRTALPVAGIALALAGKAGGHLRFDRQN